MASKTDFLELTLPENGEYVDNWDAPMNANFEVIDDHLKDLNYDLVGNAGNTDTLRGSASSLDARLNIGLAASGTLKLDSSDGYTTLENSQIYGVSTGSDSIQRVRDRFHASEKELIELRFGEYTNRYGAIVNGQNLVTGARRLASVYLNSEAIQSPIRGFAPNSVVEGQQDSLPPKRPTHFVTGSIDECSISTGSGVTPVRYNIDGIPFIVYNDLVIDIAAHAPGDATYYAYVERNASAYNGSSPQWYYRRYNGMTLGGPFRIDPRIIPTNPSLIADSPGWLGPGNSYSLDPTDGVVNAGSATLTSASANFPLFGVRRGDIVVVSAPENLAGEYVIGVTGGNTQITMTAPFRASSSSVQFHVERRTMPSFGFTTVKNYVAGRVYIGQFNIVAGLVDPLSQVAYAYNGIYDTGWLPFLGWGFGTAKKHYLGVIPSQVDVWVRDLTGNYWPDPMVIVEILVGGPIGGPYTSTTKLSLPAFRTHVDINNFAVFTTNPLNDSTKIFYDDIAAAYAGSITANYEIRVIVRR